MQLPAPRWAGASYRTSAATASPHHLPAPGGGGDSHWGPAAAASPLPETQHHLSALGRAGDAHAMSRRWAAPAASPPFGVSGCSRCCLAAIIAPRALQDRGPDRRLWTYPSTSIFQPRQTSTFLKMKVVAASCWLLPRTFLDLLLVALLQLHTRVSEYDCDLIWGRSSDAAASRPPDERIVKVVKSVPSRMGVLGPSFFLAPSAGGAL